MRIQNLRHAFSLVELLVVIAIIAVLMGLLLPAIHQVRASAASTACKNNLRQIGIALNHYHEQRGAFPIGCVEWRPSPSGQERQLAWCAFLLPFLEKSSVAEALHLDRPFDHPDNAAAGGTVIPAFLCPWSRRLEQRVQGLGATDYGGLIGERILSPNSPFKGMMVHDIAYRQVDIRDGSSLTIIVGEDSRSPDAQWINGRNLFDQAYAVNQGPPFENDLRSEHTGGAHAVFADGSVHFLTDRLPLSVLAALCTRAGGEPIGDWPP